MAWLPPHDRLALRKQVEEWLDRHRDPRDPLTQPVRLLLAMFMAATSWSGFALPVAAAALLSAGLVASVDWIAHRNAPATVEVHADEQAAMQEWIASGEASRVMRCDSDGLLFEDGRCHTTADAGWLIPLGAQQRLALEGHGRPPVRASASARNARSINGEVQAPW